MIPILLTLLLTLGLAPPALAVEGPVPALDFSVASQLLASHVYTDPFPEPVPFEGGIYFWTAAGRWSLESTIGAWNNTPDEDDHVIILQLWLPWTGPEDVGHAIIVAATFEDLAASLVATPEPTTWALVGTGLVGGAWLRRRRRSVPR